MELSKRLQAVADLISHDMVVADIGTDHGYIPIYLVETQKSKSAFAMDVNEGPLLRAKEHIAEHGLCNQIQTRQSDGVSNLHAQECDCVVIAGMGGALTVKILEEGDIIFRNLQEFILQPQSEIIKVRQYLVHNRYCIVQEEMVVEDGKFYPMMKVINGPSPEWDKVELRFGKGLLEQKHPILKQFLEKEVRTKEQILHSLSMGDGLHIELRKKEIQEELEEIKYALQRYYGDH